MKRLICLSLLMAMVCTTAFCEEWYSMGEIRGKTPDRWTQTYETRWRTVSIDTAIEIPQVDTFPILKVKRIPTVDEELLPADTYIRINAPGALQFYTGKSEYVLKDNTMYKSVDHYPGPELPQVLAEECSFTPQDALDLAYAQVFHLYGLDGSHFRLDETLVYSRIWQFKGKKTNPTYTVAVTVEGSYTIRLDQLLYGIPYFSCDEVYDDGWRGKWLNDARVSVAYRGADGYMVLAVLWQVEEVVCMDTTLLSFAEAKIAFEQEIMAGRLRTVDTVSLGYAPYADPDEPDMFWLMPVWYVRGGYSMDPKREFKPWLNEDGSIIDDGIERREVVFDAQHGELMDRKAEGKKRRMVRTPKD